jgi:plastocyanin
MNKKNLLMIIIGVFVFFESGELYAQNANVFGRIIMPAVKKKSKTSRGNLYRNRLTANSNTNKSEENNQSSYQDVIIAAYPLSFKAEVKPIQNARVIQKGAKFIPNVLAVTPGTEVEFINLDHFFHNVFSVSPGAKFNIGRRPTNTIVNKTITKKGDVALFCDIHSQMSGTIISVDTPYFTAANNNGVYLLDNLPEGDYRLEVFHPNFEKEVRLISLKKGERSEQSFTITN